ncbi:PQQ-dependent sugar dehydrogenase [Raineyella sp. LH-20]|uniref:PQQ-dependent sugar dehydrogenase n=1 Tax=Raineyella sp. LH-20 TaxID=3081204 RepID=UPI0029554984|nr:PQQ-dependent sugar dehydrogenase [Raineyella sp. LH-20]WOP17742.1 PQQ-dependent sugar dehydrogenase [Raineyella sp. LH-20]
MTVRSTRAVTTSIPLRPTVAGVALVALFAGLLAGCTPRTPGASDTPLTTPSTKVTASPSSGQAGALVPRGRPATVTSGLDAPWSIVFVDGVTLVSERDTGRILEIGADGSHREVGTVPGVVHGGEGGLLGLAVDPQRRLYVYSTGQHGNRIQRFPLTGAAGSLGLGRPVETVLDHLPSGGIHNGGRIAFGPDGMLYAGVGDSGQNTLAQDRTSLGGKILRMTPDGAVPPDNPFAGSLIWSYGHRNVQGLAWAGDGTMFATEFGQNTWDELNVIVPGGNYGWPVVEGRGGTDRGFRDPVQQWRTDQASPSGLARAGDTLFIANLRGQVLRTVPVASPGTATDHYRGTYGRLRDVTVAPDGRLWILTNNTDGRGTPAADDDRILAVDLGTP